MAILDRMLDIDISRIVARAAESTTTAVAAAETSNPPAKAEKKSGGSSSPLLFFVALGFGVVFTNLWIIVGVKYCFRYNARQRQLRMNEDGEPVSLENMPRPHRRRREKKLMTMDEVNEKFPMMKYKNWVVERAREGLPTAGGVSAHPSRANSIRDADGIVPELSAKERRSTEMRSLSTVVPSDANKGDKTESEKPKDQPGQVTDNGQTSGAQAASDAKLKRMASEDTDEEDEHIDAALPPECMAAPGDSCAICIDTLEDDDDIRGLTCGHCFHAGCVDPWLTSRRACCPLCKADYYTPKPRATDNNNDQTMPPNASLDPRHSSRLNLPSPLRSAWFRSSRSQRQPAAERGEFGLEYRRNGRRHRHTNGQVAATENERQPDQQQNQASEQPANVGTVASIRQALRFGRGRNNQPSGENGNDSAVTPSQLESATRSTPVPAQ